MHKLRCIAVDDEPLALELLEDNIRQVPFLELVASSQNAFEAMDILHEQNADLIFLDIQMPGLDGLSFVKTLPQAPMIVFVTAHKHYSLESYEINALDYLVKPVSFERFFKACTKAQEWHQLRQRADQNQQLAVVLEFMMIHIDYSLVKVNFRDILYVEGLKDYVKIYVQGSPKPLVTRMNLKGIEDQLPIQQFARIHRSYVVALDKIERLNKKSISVAGHELPLGETAHERLHVYFNLK